MKLSVWERLTSESPKFFKIITNTSVTLAAAGGALIGASATIPELVLPLGLITFSKYCIVSGIVAAAVSKTTVDHTKL